jgi:triacylglycerol lipase
MAGEFQLVPAQSPDHPVEVYPPPAPRLRHPVILAHGLFGFDQVSVLGKPMVHYFAGMPAWLRATGNVVHVSRVAPMGPIAHRASQLAQFIERHAGLGPVHLIAHSMGGLDSRFAIARLGLGDRVLSLTTLGTPHRGSVIADKVLGWTRLPPGIEHWLRRFGADLEALRDLARPSMAEFNLRVPDDPRVRYASVAGEFSPAWSWRMGLFPHRIITTPILQAEEGPNDGMVSLASARWGDHFEVWKGDHFNLVNWHLPGSRPEDENGPRWRQWADMMSRLREVETSQSLD